jgi:nucleotide-binding universal stress UspA family protein
MKPFVVNSILAPTDLSESNVPALRYARLLADHYAAKVTVLYTEPVVYPFDVGGLAGGVYISPTPEQLAQIRGQVAQQAGPAMGSRPYDIDVTVGQPIPTILSAAKERNADLIVMGTHLRHGWRRALLGSVSDGVIHGSTCPVLTVAGRDRDAGATPYAVTSIICPVNFSDVARESLHVAARLAGSFGAHLTIVHVVEANQFEEINHEADEERMRRWVSPELRDVCSYRELVVRGGAAERVLDCAEEIGADFLVIGAQHKLFRDATVIGTTTERLIRFASCPVLVVPREAVEARSRAETESQLTAGAMT